MLPSFFDRCEAIVASHARPRVADFVLHWIRGTRVISEILRGVRRNQGGEKLATPGCAAFFHKLMARRKTEGLQDENE